MNVLFIEKSLDFSSFPTVLLIAAILRLALNIATTRTILSQGHTGPDSAGHVIEAFGSLVIGNNVLIGAIVFIILIVLLTGIIKSPILKQTDIQVIPSIPHTNLATSPGIMNPFHWEAFSWISDNTETDAVIYFFYGDFYSQDAILRNTKRIHHQVDPEDFIKALQERKIKKEYVSETPGDDAGRYFRTSLV